VDVFVFLPLWDARATLKMPTAGLGIWALLAALPAGALIVEMLRMKVRRWAEWTGKRHFQAVGLVARALRGYPWH
jgi:hypothetical protein